MYENIGQVYTHIEQVYKKYWTKIRNTEQVYEKISPKAAQKVGSERFAKKGPPRNVLKTVPRAIFTMVYERAPFLRKRARA